jgi:hypothetical protein
MKPGISENSIAVQVTIFVFIDTRLFNLSDTNPRMRPWFLEEEKAIDYKSIGVATPDDQVTWSPRFAYPFLLENSIQSILPRAAVCLNYRANG